MFGRNKSDKTVWEKFPELSNIPHEKFPKHLLLIPDGNGRWAMLAHKKITDGHKKGAEVITNIYNDLWQLPLKCISIWGFSGTNWTRTPGEVDGIMHTIDETLKMLLPLAIERNERIVHVGRKDRIPAFLRESFNIAENKTKNNTGTILSLLVDYSGEDQEVRLIKAMIKDNVKSVTPKTLIKYRDGGGIVPPADLVIRTSGEQRTSDLGWLTVNSELAFIQKLLPNIGSKDIVEAIIDYTKRERRFGGRPNTQASK